MTERYLVRPKRIKLENGKLLILRRPKLEDAADMVEYLNIIGGESDNLLFGKGEMTFTLEQERKYIEDVNADENSLLLLGTLDGAIVSIANITAPGRKRIAHNSEIGLSVKKSCWRMGIGEAMIKELISFALHHDRISIVNLGVRAQNSNAIKLYEKMGFSRIGVRKDYFNIEGKYYDEILMAIHLKG